MGCNFFVFSEKVNLSTVEKRDFLSENIEVIITNGVTDIYIN